MAEKSRKAGRSYPDSEDARMQGVADRMAGTLQEPVVCMGLEGGTTLRTIAISPPGQVAPDAIELADHPRVAESLHRGEPAFLDVDLSSAFDASQALLVPWAGKEKTSGAVILVGASPGTHPPRRLASIAAMIPESIRAVRETNLLERRIAELEQTSSAFRALVETTSDAVQVMDLDGRVRVWNAACEKLYGYTAKEVIGQVLPHIPPGERQRWVSDLRKSAALGEESTRDVVSARKDGSLFGATITSLPLKDADGLPVGMFTIVRSIDADSRLDRMQSDFLALVTQELKNPLTAILGYTQLLSRPEIRDDPSKRARTARALEQRAQEMSGLVDDLMLASRVDQGELVLRRSPTDLAALVTEAVSRAETSAPRHRFAIDVDTKVPPADIDAARVAQALAQLLSNAVKHSTWSEEVVVRVVREGAFASVSVTDRGEGMSDEELTRAFDRFYKAQGSSRDPGIGLGLFLVRSIVEAHGGTVTVVSKHAKGSTFTMRLPLAVS